MIQVWIFNRPCPLFLLFSLLCVTSSLFAQTNLYSGGNGNVAAITWYTSATRTGATGTPGANTVLNIGSNHTVTFPSGTTNVTYAGISVNDNGGGGIFQFGSAGTNTTLTISGSITVNAGGTFRAGGTGGTHTLNVGGNITNNNILDFTQGAANHTLVLNGTAAQTISGTGASFLFERLTLNSGNNVSLNRSASISTALTFSANGLLIVDANSNLTLAAAATITGANANRYIQLDGTSGTNSQLIKLNAANVAQWRILYPIGTPTGGYTPLDLTTATITTNPTNNSSIAIKAVFNQSVPGQMRRSFRIVVTGNAALTTFTNGQFYYNAATDVSTGDVLSSYSTIRYQNGTTVSTITGTAPGAGYFTAPTAALSLATGTYYFSMGSSTIWYSYQNGQWSNQDVWTLDPSGTSLANPLAQIPLPGDQVVILNGFTVTCDMNNIVLANTTIEGGGTLDIGATVGHNLGAVDGSGLLRINGTTLPTGTYNSFVTAGTGGTIEYYNTAGILPTGQLTYNNLLLTNNTTNNIVFTLASNLTVNGNLTVDQTAGSGTVTWLINNNTATQRTIVLNGDLTVKANGQIRAGTGTPANAHNLTLYGNLINNGSIKFFNPGTVLTDANYNSGAVNTTARRGDAVNVTFSGLQNQTVSCNNQTDFYQLIVNKGTGQQAMLTVNSTNTDYFRLFGPNNLDYSGNAPDYISNNALSIQNGTLQLQGSIDIPTLVVAEAVPAIGGGWPIPQDGALWLNGDNVTVQVTTTATGDNGRQMYVFGLLRVTKGTLNLGYSRGLLGGGAGVFLMEGGTVNTPQLRTTYLGTNNRFAYNQHGGTVNVGTTGQNGPVVNTYPRFALPYPECTFEMTGGTINVANPMNGGTSDDGGILISAATSNINVTGGTVNAILPASAVNFTITSTAPFYNLNISKAGAGTSLAILNAMSFNDNTGYTRPAQPLIVLNDLILEDTNTPTLNCNSNNLTVGGNLNIKTGATLLSGANTITFNGTGAQSWTNNGTINSTAGANPPTLNNIVINKTAGVLSLKGSGAFPGTTGTATGTIAGLTLTAGTLDIEGKNLTIITTLSNSATQIGSGVVTANGPTVIDGSNGTFGNLTLQASQTVTTVGNQTLTGDLRLIGANTTLNINSNNLTIWGNIYSNATTGVAFTNTKRILTGGLRNDGGLTRKATSGIDLLFPFGTGTLYTPATINVTASTAGMITVRPVNAVHPNANPTGQSLLYFWRVTSTGFSSITSVIHKDYTFSNTAFLAGTTTAYKPARYDANTFTWSIGTTYAAAGTTKIPNFSFGANLDGEYTAGNITAGPVGIFYSRKSGLWNDNQTWSNTPCTAPGACGPAVATNVFPCASCAVVIGDANNNHEVTIDANNRTSGSLFIATGSTLDCSTWNTGLNFGTNTGETVAGRGTLKIASAVFPAGDFSNFIGPNGGTVEWYGATKTIPATGSAPQSIVLDNYYNLVVSPSAGATITLPTSSLTVYNHLTSGGAGTVNTNSGTAKTINILGDFNVVSGVFQTQSGNATNFSLNGTTTINANATFRVANTTGTTHSITTAGSIINNGTLTLRNGTHVVNLAFTGNNNTLFTGTNGAAITTLNNVTINKGTSQTPTLTFDVAGTVNVLNTTGWLTLLNGTLDFNKAGAAYTLVSTAVTYTIPETSRLKVRSGTINVIGNIGNNSADLLLAGALEVAGGTVNLNAGATAFNNDIEYASAGTPSIIVSGGSLYVNGGIRRPTTTLAGALVYNQSSGVVTIGGQNTNATNSRAVFEIESNNGSSFSLTGDARLIIARPNNGTAFADVYINPALSSVEATSTIEIGATVGGQNFEINIVPPVGNLIVGTTTTSQTVDLQSSPLTISGTLSINTGSLLETNTLDVMIGGNLDIQGTGIYNGTILGGNTTIFNGSGAQAATLSAGSTFQNITVDKPVGTVTLAGTSPTINNLNLLNGILDVNDLPLKVQGDIINNSTQIGSAGGAIVLTGTSTLQNITSANGSFHNLTLEGSGASKNVKLTGNLTINGTLTFSADNRYFTIGSSQLTFGSESNILQASSVRFIRTNGASSDQGVVKVWKQGSQSFTYEVGSLNYYTPVGLTLNVTTPGNITVVPVNQRHPTANLGSDEQILNYYWMVTRDNIIGYTNTGAHTYTFPAGLMSNAPLGTRVAGYLDPAPLDPDAQLGWITEEPNYGGSSTPTSITFTNQLNYNLPSATNTFHYSAGTQETLPNPIEPIYSNLNDPNVSSPLIGGSWTNANSWTTVSTGYGPPLQGAPPLGVPIVILNGARINANANARSAFISRINGLLVLGTSTQHNLGTISGTGTIRTSTNTFPAGNYNKFVSAAGGTIEYVAPMTMNSRSTYNNVSFIGSGNVTMTNTDLTLNGSWAIAGGVTVNNPNTRSITAAGNWVNLGTFVGGNNTVTLNGSVNQNITGTTFFYNLVINKTGGNVSLTGTGTTTVNNQLTLTSRHIEATATHPLSLTAAATINGGSASSFIAGPVRKVMAAATTFAYPLGSITPERYRPVSINNTTVGDTWTVRYFGINPTNDGYANMTMNTANIRTVSEFEYWNITPAGAGAAGVTLTYNVGSYNPPDIGEVAKLRVAHWDGTQWDLPAGGGAHTQNGTNVTGTVSVTNVTSFSPFTLASLTPWSPLPVTWLEFSAERVSYDIVLNWETAQEQNNDRFEVERSEDGRTFTKIGTENSNGNSSSVTAYTFVDTKALLSQRYYYRIKQIDYNGAADYSKIIAVSPSEETVTTRWAVFPNPVENGQGLTIKLTGLTKATSNPVQITFFSSNGKVAYHDAGSLEEVQQRLAQFAYAFTSGVYALKISEGSYYEVYRVIKL